MYAEGSPSGLLPRHSTRAPSTRPRSSKRLRILPQAHSRSTTALPPGGISSRQHSHIVIHLCMHKSPNKAIAPLNFAVLGFRFGMFSFIQLFLVYSILCRSVFFVKLREKYNRTTVVTKCYHKKLKNATTRSYKMPPQEVTKCNHKLEQNVTYTLNLNIINLNIYNLNLSINPAD